MADLCLECLQKSEPNANKDNAVLSGECYVCDGCGEIKPIVEEYTDDVKCFYCGTTTNNATTKKGLYVCCCYRLHNDNGKIAQHYSSNEDRLTAENGRLKAEIERLRKILKVSYKELEEYEKKIDDGIEVCHHCHEKYAEKIKAAKIKACKEIADEIKLGADNILSPYCATDVICKFDDFVDDIVKRDCEEISQGI